MSAEHLTSLLTDLQQQIAQLMKRCDDSESYARQLEEELAESRRREQQLEHDKQEIAQKYRNLQAGTMGHQSEAEVARLRERYLAMIREIDGCIEKLNGKQSQHQDTIG